MTESRRISIRTLHVGTKFMVWAGMVSLVVLTISMADILWARDTTNQSAVVEHTGSSGAPPTEEAPDAKAAAASTKRVPSKYWIVNVLRDNAALVIFITLALGYFIGGIKIGHFSLGAVTGTLLVGVLIGQLDISISDQVKSVFFTMFLFAVGYSIGPQFVRGVAHDGARQAIFSVVICVVCLLCTYIAAKVAGFDAGLAAGVWAGAQTISASIGFATDAINHSGVRNTQEMLDNIPVAYAITYLWGTIGTGLILTILGPKLIGADLKKACKEYESRMSTGAPAGGMDSAWHQLEIRAFEVVADSKIIGKTVSAAEALATDQLYVERIQRDGKTIDFDGNTTFHVGDLVAVSGPTEALMTIGQHTKEVAARELLDIPVESVDIVITHKDVNGRTLADLAKDKFARGVYLRKITRGATSVNVPILAQTTIHRGDILSVTGTRSHVSRVEKSIGYADRPTDATDMVWVGLFICLSGLLGALSMDIGGVSLTLSVTGGLLCGGLVLGWLRSVHPTFGRLPAPTQWFMNSVGLNVFIAIVGISAGPSFVAGIKSTGVGLLICGVFATSTPLILAPIIGTYLFRFDPAVNLGCCGGARTSTASVAMVCDEAKSNIPMLGYTVPYAVSNMLKPIMGMIIVLMY